MTPLAILLSEPAEITLGGLERQIVITHRVLLESAHELRTEPFAVPDFQSARVLRSLLKWSIGDYKISPRDVRHVRSGLLAAWSASMPNRRKTELDSDAKSLTPLRAWAIARDMGLSSDEWLDMTPRQLWELSELRRTRMQREELLVGILASTVANFSTRGPKRPTRAEQFMLHPFEEEHKGLSIGDQVMSVMSSVKPKGRK